MGDSQRELPIFADGPIRASDAVSFWKSARTSSSKFLSSRAVLRDTRRPNRKNTAIALIYVVVALPATFIAFIVLSLRRILRPPLEVTVLPIGSEFSFTVGFFEHLRGSKPDEWHTDLILALSRWPHNTLTSLYRKEFDRPILWTKGASGIVQQALLLQPAFLVDVMRLQWKSVLQRFNLAQVPLKDRIHLAELRQKTMGQLNLGNKEFVVMAVHSRSYDAQRNPHYAAKGLKKESTGASLTPGVDFLRSQNLDVIMLGSPDAGITRIPRSIPRLAEFGTLGGPHEVALASGCKYFWSDSAGAMWLSVPFHRPILISNQYSIALTVDIMKWWQSANFMHLVIPVRFEDGMNHKLTFRDELSDDRGLNSRNNLTWIRNSSQEIVEAHREMIARLNGTFVENLSLRKKFDDLYDEYPRVIKPNIATSFLTRHPYLLE